MCCVYNLIFGCKLFINKSQQIILCRGMEAKSGLVQQQNVFTVLVALDFAKPDKEWEKPKEALAAIFQWQCYPVLGIINSDIKVADIICSVLDFKANLKILVGCPVLKHFICDGIRGCFQLCFECFKIAFRLNISNLQTTQFEQSFGNFVFFWRKTSCRFSGGKIIQVDSARQAEVIAKIP